MPLENTNNLFSTLLNRVHIGQSPQFLEAIPAESIALTLTSPPYYDDELYILDDGELEFGWKSYDDYLSHLNQTLDELYRITIPGGHVVLVLSNSPQTDANEHITHYWPIVHDLIHYAVKQNWTMQDEIIWAKKEPSYPYIQNRSTPETSSIVRHDLITVLRKPGPIRDGYSSIPISSVWHLKDRGDIQKYNKAYPSFPDQLVRRVIRSWSLEEDIVLDPYAGSGQVCRIALELDRFTIGVEMDEQWQDLWHDINST